MNADRLLALYNQVADAPDAIPRLRRFVLDLAVRGKLVEQDPNDEPAEQLLKRIAAEKARLVEAGVIKKPKQISSSQEAGTPVPLNWADVPLGEVILQHLGGGTPSKSNENYWNGGIHWASVKDVGKSKYVDDTTDRITDAGLANSSSNLIEPGNLLVVTRMGLGKVSINRIPVAINQDLRALFLSQNVSIDYAYSFFLTHGFKGTGLTVKGIKLEELLRIRFPLPPLAEQHRIVAKVDELMALLDKLEAARSTREATRGRLTASSLARLTAPNTSPEVFPAHARFAMGALPALSARPDQIKSLRQTILNLAVRGKLVEQDPNDEPASELLKRIAAEKMRLVKQGTTSPDRTTKEPPSIVELFELPTGWVWSNLQSLCISISDGDHQPPPKSISGVPFLVIGNVRTKKINYDTERMVPKSYFDGLDPSKRPQSGDILYTLVGSFGIPVPVLSDRPFCVQRHIGILRPAPQLSSGALPLFLESEFVFRQAKIYATGIAQKTVSLAGLRSILLPLPPLAEQQRIVEKVDALMALCDRLEAALATADITRQRLLESLLHEALTEGAHNREVA